MSHEVIAYMMKNGSILSRLQFQLVLQCAPFLKRLKNACIINIEQSGYQGLYTVLLQTNIKYCVLMQQQSGYLVMFYREAEFHAYLARPDVQNFLRYYGYDQFEIPEVLSHLISRMHLFSQKADEFPHEIGVFMEYPLEDVKGYIRYKGQHCLCSGYWKVYCNPGRAQTMFGMYDYAKTCAVNELLAGKSVREIAGA